jgi:uncharacterized membrane protein
MKIDDLSEKDVRELAKRRGRTIDILFVWGCLLFFVGCIGWFLWGFDSVFPALSHSSSEDTAVLDLVKNSGVAVRMTCSGEGVVFDGENLTANKSACEVVIGKTAPGGSEVKIITG